MKTVIIGGVAGGATCAARLRRVDESAEIVVLERGEYISYANCGLPYHVSGVIKDRRALLLQTPAEMKAKFNVTVKVKNEVIAINRGKKTVTVKNLNSPVGETYEETYDKLVIATGSSPIRPNIPGADLPRVKTIWTVPDTDLIISFIKENNVKTAAVVGGGFIGLEMAENLSHAGIKVTLIEMLGQVMAPLDFEMAQILHQALVENGVKLCLGDGVSMFSDKENEVEIKLQSGGTVSAELVILAVGVKPNGELAKAAGLEVNPRGGVKVDDHMQTSDKDIYAVGDVIEVNDFIFGGKTMIPLAGPANKQGRIAADNIAGGDKTYAGSQGSSVAKVFDLTAASTGANEKTLIKRGMVKGKDYERVIIVQNSHAGYYPGAFPMTIKLLFSADGKKIFGAQIVGSEGVDKRIDTLGEAIRLGAGVSALTELEFAYAPPYSSAKDPVNMAGYVAENLLDGKVKFADWDEAEKNPGALLLDVREYVETMAFSYPGATVIPLGELRDRLDELDKNKRVIVFCAIGVRAYNAARILSQHGFEKVFVYPGGSRFYKATHYKDYITHGDAGFEKTLPPEKSRGKSITLDCSGLQCPGPIMRVFETIQSMKDGETLEVTASDPGFVRDAEVWCRRTGNTLVSKGQDGKNYTAVIKKGSGEQISGRAGGDGKTIIVFSGDLDKVIASFIIANGGAAMGRKVTMFFTFWGLTVLRKTKRQKVKKTFMEKAFGFMLPRGSGRLKLSKMNMGGMGTAMMKKIMRDKNVDSLDSLIEKALKNGVKIIACTMSMDVMGIKKEELIDGVDFAGVGTFLGEAEESNVNLFI
ncbi:MAG: FAD-dependent oxidoreductase [Eubacteriales bacterium]